VWPLRRLQEFRGIQAGEGCGVGCEPAISFRSPGEPYLGRKWKRAESVPVLMSLIEYTLLAAGSLFAIVDPIAVVPAFVAMTARDSQVERIRMARLACAVAAGVMLLFVLAGTWIFKLLGVTLPAFQIAGSVLLFRIALDMLYAKRTGARETVEEVEAGAAKDDIAITPLGVPMLAGPGAISAALILRAQAQGAAQ
jgi:multiple antibiotic resistance protein